MKRHAFSLLETILLSDGAVTATVANAFGS